MEELPLNFETSLMQIVERLDKNQIPVFCNILLGLWKVRNKEIFAAKIPVPHTILAWAHIHEIVEPQPQTRRINRESFRLPGRERVIFVDASWDEKYGAGIGMAVYNMRGDLVFNNSIKCKWEMLSMRKHKQFYWHYDMGQKEGGKERCVSSQTV